MRKRLRPQALPTLTGLTFLGTASSNLSACLGRNKYRREAGLEVAPEGDSSECAGCFWLLRAVQTAQHTLPTVPCALECPSGGG